MINLVQLQNCAHVMILNSEWHLTYGKIKLYAVLECNFIINRILLDRQVSFCVSLDCYGIIASEHFVYK